MREPFKKYPELFTNIIFLIGNGSSRKDFDLNTLKGKGTIIGCNALYRDFFPDILVCQDAKMIKELKTSKYSGLILSTKGAPIKSAIKWNPGNTRTSGVLALKIITRVFKPLKCYAIGMDGYDGNVYANTPNYIHDPLKFNKITEQYKTIISTCKIEVINVNIKDSWDISNVPNYRHITYNQFKKELGL